MESSPHTEAVDESSADGLAVEARDGVLRIALDRPDRKNALDPVTTVRFVRALEDASTDESHRAVLVTGNGPDFCASADWVGSNAGDVRPRTGSIQRRVPLQHNRLISLLLEIQLPVVCQVQGWAAGLGCQIALAADFTIASDESRFWFPFAKRGFSPDSGSTWLLPRLVGVARAKELLLLGRPVSGADAAAWGMIHRAVPDGELGSAVDGLVTELAGAATVAVGLAKHCIHRSLALGLDEAMVLEAHALELASRSPDFKEGMRAFTERRDPEFGGR
jgi:2-(1,2-epoxy-1,2-dihydrophenyl)acetyl-CoA isomerase